MLLVIDARLSAPPSAPAVFRDVTLYSKIFLHYDVVSTCGSSEKDLYAQWFRRYGLFDFVDDLVEPREVAGVDPQIFLDDGWLNESSLAPMISTLRRLKPVS